MKVYVLLDWFWDGDDNLINSFVGVYRTKDQLHQAYLELEKGISPPHLLYWVGDTIPKEDDGCFRSRSFYQAIAVKIREV